MVRAPVPVDEVCRPGVCAAHPELHAALERFNGRMGRMEDGLAHEAEANADEHRAIEDAVRAGNVATEKAIKDLGEKLTAACVASHSHAQGAHARIDWWQTRMTAVVIALVLVGTGWSWATSAPVVGVAQAIVNNHQASQHPTPAPQQAPVAAGGS